MGDDTAEAKCGTVPFRQSPVRHRDKLRGLVGDQFRLASPVSDCFVVTAVRWELLHKVSLVSASLPPGVCPKQKVCGSFR